MQKSLENNYVIVLAILMMTTMLAHCVINEVGVGVILDLDSDIGKSSRVCIILALEELYGTHQNNFTTFIQPHFRNSKYDDYEAASLAIDLIKNSQVMVILGPQQSSQANFVLDIANRFKVPVVSPATSPDLSSKQNPYFIRIAHASSTQAEPIASLFNSFGWKEVAFIYEDSDYGRGPIPYLFNAMENVGTQVKYSTSLPPLSTDNQILQNLYKLKRMKLRVFVVHMLPPLASRFFEKASEVGMMGKGYVWIITDVLTSLLHLLDPRDLDYMQGVIGVKPYVSPSKKLTNFERKWRMRFQKEYPEIDRFEVDVFGIWLYDFVFALGTALKRVEVESCHIGTSEMRSRILPMIQNVRVKGLSGDFHVVNGQLQTSVYQIGNVIGNGEKRIGFWNKRFGLSKKLNQKDDLGAIIWPGDTLEVPNGFDAPKKLRVGLPSKGAYPKLIYAYVDHKTNKTNATGFLVDVFRAIIKAMPYVVHYKFIAFENPDGSSAGNYDDLVQQVVPGRFDVVAGDVTILGKRANNVSFTLPYTEYGVGMLVLVKVDNKKNPWIFLNPLERNLWITIGVFFIYTGFVVWVLEHRVNKEFRGPPRQQVGMIFWFSFSTLVFAHREKMTNNLSRFVVIVWVFVVLVLSSSYTASLASMLTIQNFEPAFKSIRELIAKGHYIGCQNGSFVGDMLIKDMGLSSDKLKRYTKFNETEKSLLDGTVSAIVDEIPYLKMLQAKHCNKYYMVGPIYNSEGFGLAFPQGSPLVANFSRAILTVVEDQMTNISKKWFGNKDDCSQQNGGVQPFQKLTVNSFKGLFLIAGLASTYALIVFSCMFLYENREILVSQGSMHEKLVEIVRSFNEVKDKKAFELETKTTIMFDNLVFVQETMQKAPAQSLTYAEHQGGVATPPNRV